MGTIVPGSHGFAPIRLLGGPLDGQVYGDIPIMADGSMPISVSIPLDVSIPHSEYGAYERNSYDFETDMHLYTFTGIHSGIKTAADVEAAGALAAPTSVHEVETESTDAVPEESSPMKMPAQRFILEQSWWIASELCRRHSNLRIYELHPGGGMYDVLRVFDPLLAQPGEGGVIDMNRAGRIHLHDVPGYAPIEWNEAISAESPHQLVKILEGHRRWALNQQSPPTTRASLSYRVLSRVLSSKLNDRERWDVRSLYADVDSLSAGVREHLSTAFPGVESLTRELRETTAPGVPVESRLWAITRAEKPVLLLDDRGFAYTTSGSRIDLFERYSTGASVDTIVASFEF